MNATTTPDRPISRREIRLQMDADRAKQAQREIDFTAMAARLEMKLLAIGDTRAAFATTERTNEGRKETTQVRIYEINAAYSRTAWTPGKCIAILNRQDMMSDDFETLAKLMVL